MPPPQALRLFSRSARAQSSDLAASPFPPREDCEPARVCPSVAPVSSKSQLPDIPQNVFQLALDVAKSKESVQFFLVSNSANPTAGPTFLVPSPRPRSADTRNLPPRAPFVSQSPPSPTTSASPTPSIPSDFFSDASTASTRSMLEPSKAAKRRLRNAAVRHRGANPSNRR